jgi:ATP-binding cassette subfamily B protein
MSKKGRLPQWLLEANRAIRQLAQAVCFVWDSSPAWTIASIILLSVQGVLPLLSLYIMKLVVDAITVAITTPDIEMNFVHIGLLIGFEGLVALFLALSGVAANWVSGIHSEIVTDYMHNITHAKSIEADLEYYETAKYHDTQHRAQNEAFYRPSKILNDLIRFGQSGISLLVMAGLLFFFHWAIVLILFFTVVPGILVRIRYSGILYQWRRGRTSTERKAWYFHWMLAGDAMAKEIRLFDLGKMFMDNYSNLRAQLRNERLRITTKRAIAEAVSQVGTNTAIFGSYAFIAYRTFQGLITLGDLLLYYRAFQHGQGFLREMLGGLADLYEDNMYLSDLFEFLSLERKVKEPRYPMPVPRPMQRGIVFNHVDFQYPTGINRMALQGVSLTIRPGETIALVGENGSGKTTLVKLLCRLYDTTNGSIKIDEMDLHEFRTEELRREFGVIFQDFARYNLTAKENIGFGNIHLPVDMDRIRRAAKSAGADKVISELKHDYDTILGKWFEDGEELSFGEWQKVALARAFIRDAQFIVLDEPTSSMDAKAEYEIFKKFREMTAGKTSIIISHRFSTVRMADSIYVLNNGKIVESGSHEDLIALKGKYATMFEMQAEAYR